MAQRANIGAAMPTKPCSNGQTGALRRRGPAGVSGATSTTTSTVMRSRTRGRSNRWSGKLRGEAGNPAFPSWLLKPEEKAHVYRHWRTNPAHHPAGHHFLAARQPLAAEFQDRSERRDRGARI